MQTDVVRLTSGFIAQPTSSELSNVPFARHVAGLLDELQFQVEEVEHQHPDGVDKLSIVARRGRGPGGLTLICHSDTVPAAREDGWTTDPYAGTMRGERLHGRGACDMKGALAAVLCAAARWTGTELARPLCILVTADEETQARGARQVVSRSRLFAPAARGYGVICEPTRLRVVHAHKGALTMKITARGRAAHTSTLKGINANIKMIPFLNDMKSMYERVLTEECYRNEDFDPPHSEWSLGISDHNPATNMSPARSICSINYRTMPGVDADGLIQATRASARRHGLRLQLVFAGEPLYTAPDSALVRMALQITSTRKPRTVAYGTDGLALSRKMKEMIVVGPGDIAQAHTVDEWIDLDQLRRSVDVYSDFIERVCVRNQD